MMAIAAEFIAWHLVDTGPAEGRTDLRDETWHDHRRKIAVLFYNAVRHGMDYADPGASYYEERYRQRVLTNLQRRAKAFGYVLQPTEIKAVSMAVS
jgi:hypothetical protein